MNSRDRLRIKTVQILINRPVELWTILEKNLEFNGLFPDFYSKPFTERVKKYKVIIVLQFYQIISL